jgi:hypothetical protein
MRYKLGSCDVVMAEHGTVMMHGHFTALLDASKEVGLEVNSEKTKYMLVQGVRRQDRGRA